MPFDSSLGNCRESRVESNMSRVETDMSRVQKSSISTLRSCDINAYFHHLPSDNDDFCPAEVNWNIIIFIAVRKK